MVTKYISKCVCLIFICRSIPLYGRNALNTNNVVQYYLLWFPLLHVGEHGYGSLTHTPHSNPSCTPFLITTSSLLQHFCWVRYVLVTNKFNWKFTAVQEFFFTISRQYPLILSYNFKNAGVFTSTPPFVFM